MPQSRVIPTSSLGLTRFPPCLHWPCTLQFMLFYWKEKLIYLLLGSKTLITDCLCKKHFYSISTKEFSSVLYRQLQTNKLPSLKKSESKYYLLYYNMLLLLSSLFTKTDGRHNREHFNIAICLLGTSYQVSRCHFDGKLEFPTRYIKPEAAIRLPYLPHVFFP